MIVLFVVLIALPQDRLRTGIVRRRRRTARRVAEVVRWLAARALHRASCSSSRRSCPAEPARRRATASRSRWSLLSLVLLTGYGGMVSLCQMTFVGIGAYDDGPLGHGGSLLGVLAAVGLRAVVGAVMALPTLRMRGLYLALATFAFATVMDQAVFTQVLRHRREPRRPAAGHPRHLRCSRTAPTSSSAPSSSRSLRIACSPYAAGRSDAGWSRSTTRRRPARPSASTSTGPSSSSSARPPRSPASPACCSAGPAVSVGATTSTRCSACVVLLLARVGGINTATGALLGAFVFALFPVAARPLPAAGQPAVPAHRPRRDQRRP